MSEQQLPLSDFIEYPQSEMLERATRNYLNLKRRHSIRNFSDRAVPKEIIEQCILAAGSAPNGANHQPWHFVAISSPKIKSQIREQAEAIEQAFYAGRGGEEWLENLKPLGTDANKPYLDKAPWLIAIFTKKRSEDSEEAKQNYYVHESVGIATGFLIQALHNSGLATLTHTPKPMSFLSKVCGRDNDNERPYMLIVAGYPHEAATVPEHALKKKALNEICDFL
ncbi:nitroreductase family protein [Alginatibacterium sediminis]|uniref:Nitroreductase family protein n=1 Tax=Alginatibacterium sediminis TaxID=2164068 RepID=A0A420EGI7_9ALTE|nr:nitroreductase family protein [Alginatibacterium sediminis]RKF19825.1 nitroreductase family protein [Alginatibacterium sediminis]